MDAVTCSAKISAKVEIDLKNVSKKYVNYGFRGFLPIQCFGYQYVGVIGCIGPNEDQSHVALVFFMIDSENITAQFDLKITDVFGNVIELNENLTQEKDRVDFYPLRKLIGRVDFICGKISVTFEPSEDLVRRQSLLKEMACKMIEDCEGEANFKISCKNDGIEESARTMEFNKDFLSKISEVFRRMIENTNTREAKEGMVKMDDVNFETIKTFKKVFTHRYIDGKDLSVDLMMFAHKYDIGGLVELCSEYLEDNLDKDIILDVIKAAYFIEDSKLFKKAVAFLMTNLGKIEETPEWNELKKCHPDCFIKITEIMLFEHKFSETLKFQ